MTISVTRRFLVHFIRSITYVLWAADIGTGLRPVVYFLIIIYSALFVGIRSVDLGSVLNGVLVSYRYTPLETISFENIYPLKYGVQLPPSISAISAGVYDRRSGKTLFSRLPEEKLAPASTTKLMTTLVALELYSPEEKVTVPYFCTNIESTKAWLPADEEFTARDLIYTMLVGSAGDAACALATSKVSYSEFVDKMNQKAVVLGMKNTNFVNPIGLDGFKGVHYSTVSDLYLLALASLSNETVQNAVKTKEFTVKSLTSDFTYKMTNTNRFLWEIAGTTGIKTGTTVGAGEVLIYGWKDKDRELVLIVMGSRDRFGDTRNLLNWSLDNYTWKTD
ncbi:TPA: hypothetical protein DEP93_01645 [candidate division WWE3 bacterium]|uniref:Peptidase S11 D-alanyl-D-alanine carboxypeptidase A N-terminal domain-containing protein n=1 Tax=candidate division WWE3 bacterium TaxID=2053526 RepID=A0A3D0ZR05_UNCKA|nr:MAG: hypothetical protein A2245_01250 [candidate division WWE3 bacterium RIFOXYA2_FULL_43_12]OGC72023.1 MAG: hypothetical protein A2337_01495 [candidate division WWE3 bacterium RIFOXYB2_FULL_43_9]HBY09810.1 hypothetical protein [candidate division WWE3 bacterium]HCC42153.1 hypothetical protein [candidate division WWE3 bacterium]